MNSFDKAMAGIEALRRRFDKLLEAARETADTPRQTEPPVSRQLRELSEFGSNPGELRMFMHIPERLPSAAPLVVALHGCSQTAQDYDCGTGWSALADRLGFAVLLPEQQPANNPKNCFTWFSPRDTARGQGEAFSIRQMIEHAVATYGLDPSKVFVTGLSAGGAMANAMLAAYPEVFAGGAIIAGLPYGAARTVQEAFDAMFRERSHDARVLGTRVRSASSHRGPWPKISIWHGTADPIVKPSNAEDLLRQWTNVHGLPATPSVEETVGGHSHRAWLDAEGNTLVEAFSIDGMTHGVPLATEIDEACGAVGPFFHDAGISSTYHIAKFWRLSDDAAVSPRAGGALKGQSSVRAVEPSRMAMEEDRVAADDRAAPAFDPSAEQPGYMSCDPSAVINAAFKAAGLPMPGLPNGMPGAVVRATPGPLIEAVLKAAGLNRR